MFSYGMILGGISSSYTLPRVFHCYLEVTRKFSVNSSKSFICSSSLIDVRMSFALSCDNTDVARFRNLFSSSFFVIGFSADPKGCRTCFSYIFQLNMRISQNYPAVTTMTAGHFARMAGTRGTVTVPVRAQATVLSSREWIKAGYGNRRLQHPGLAAPRVQPASGCPPFPDLDCSIRTLAAARPCYTARQPMWSNRTNNT